MANGHASVGATSVIGSSAFVRGRITGTGDLEIAGRVEGEVTCSGDVLVESGGLVAASISARRIVVRGAVKGDLTAEDAVVLEAGARVVGDLRAPRIAIAPGGLVRGHVQTGAAGAARPRSTSATASRVTPPAARVAATKAAPAARVVEQAPATKKQAPAPAPAARAAASSSGNGERKAATRPGPPPPVVPVLKKGTKAVAHHKKRG
jgi:cytoskeletal protein CcmA (bactofilin family)